MGSHTFNSSSREVETGMIRLDGEETIRQEETGTQGSLRIHRVGCSLRMQSEMQPGDS